MKKILSLLSVVLCSLLLLCGCNQEGVTLVPPSMFQYLKVELNNSDFASDEEVTITASIGIPEAELAKYSDTDIKALLIISQYSDIAVTEENVYILKEITDFTPYICGEENGNVLYNSIENYVVPQKIFNKENGKFYCSFCFTSAEDENLSMISTTIQYPVLYEMNEDGITLGLNNSSNNNYSEIERAYLKYLRAKEKSIDKTKVVKYGGSYSGNTVVVARWSSNDLNVAEVEVEYYVDNIFIYNLNNPSYDIIVYTKSKEIKTLKDAYKDGDITKRNLYSIRKAIKEI